MLISSGLIGKLRIEFLKPLLRPKSTAILAYTCHSSKIAKEPTRSVAQHSLLIRVLLEICDVLMAHHVVDDLRAPLLTTLKVVFISLSSFGLLFRRDGTVTLIMEDLRARHSLIGG